MKELLLKTFNGRLVKSTDVYEDNSGAIDIAKYGNFTKNSKHIEVHYHYVHKNVKENVINIVKVNSEDNISDIFTKALCKEKCEKFRYTLNLSCT